MDDDEPAVMGAGGGPSPMPSDQERAEAEWRLRYIAQMVKSGVDRADAVACCLAGDVNLDESPEDSADDEMSYWGEDDGSPC